MPTLKLSKINAIPIVRGWVDDFWPLKPPRPFASVVEELVEGLKDGSIVMPTTLYAHRIILVVPVAKVAAVTTWITANVDPTCDPLLGPPLNATGLVADPVTHRWACQAWPDSECRQLLAKLCQLASVTPPTLVTWNGWTGAQKRTWLAGVRAAVLAGFGVYVSLAQNDGQWDDPAAVLAAMNLKTIGVP